jgi:hypothetical protein
MQPATRSPRLLTLLARLALAASAAACASAPDPEDGPPAVAPAVVPWVDTAGLAVVTWQSIAVRNSRLSATPNVGAGARDAYMVVAVVIDTVGRVEPGSVRFLHRRGPPDFVFPTCDWFRLAEFVPVRVRGARRRAAAVLPFAFFGTWPPRLVSDAELDAETRRLRQRPLWETVQRLERLPGCGTW